MTGDKRGKQRIPKKRECAEIEIAKNKKVTEEMYK